MKLTFGKLALAAAAALLMTGCATTPVPGPMAENDALCSYLDTNHDGKITKEEFVARATDKDKASKIFDKCDSGQKGYLTYEEVGSQRVLLPPEINMMSTPVVRQYR
jgi:hypothetical protein